MKRLITVLFLTILISGCTFGNQSEKVYELTIFFDNHPSTEFQRDLHNLTDVYNISKVKMDFDKPSHIKKFPTFFILGPNGQFETKHFEELKGYLEEDN